MDLEVFVLQMIAHIVKVACIWRSRLSKFFIDEILCEPIETAKRPVSGPLKCFAQCRAAPPLKPYGTEAHLSFRNLQLQIVIQKESDFIQDGIG